MKEMIEKLSGLIWGGGLAAVLLGAGAFFTVKLRGIQLRLPMLLLKKDKSGRKELFRTACMSLGTAMGTGNITGVAAALSIGGAGALFWMWASALLGMALVYAENYLSCIYSTKSLKGPMAYLEEGLRSPALGAFFALCCVLASFGMGGMVQVNSFAETMPDNSSLRVIIAAAAFLLILAVTSGGAGRIGTAAQLLLPAASLAYIAVCIAVLIRFKDALPGAFADIFSHALGLKQAAGGAAGCGISVGIRRGIFSNEAGLGSSPILHSSACAGKPGEMGALAMAEVFFDTVICCTLTGLTLLCAGADAPGSAFLPVTGGFTNGFISAEMGLFAFCTVIGWYFCGECAFLHLTHGKLRKLFCVIFAIAASTGALISLETVWALSDIFNGLMVFPNLTGLLLLSKNVKRE